MFTPFGAAYTVEVPEGGHPACPHCGSTDVDRGATGLDECRACSARFRETGRGAPGLANIDADDRVRRVEL
jgi:ribosomal protein L37AE/L43A